MSGLSQQQLEDFSTDICCRILKPECGTPPETLDIYWAVENMRPLSLKEQWDLFTNAEMPEECHEVCLCSSNTGLSIQIVPIVSYCLDEGSNKQSKSFD